MPTFPFATSWERGLITHAGSIFFVDDSSSMDTNDPMSGATDMPFTTLAYALSRCTANKGDVLYVMPGHSESVATALALTPKAGVTLVFLGLGLMWTMETSGVEAYRQVARTVCGLAKALPATTTGTIFTVAGGPVRVTELFGIVTTVIQAQATTIQFVATATGLSAVTISGTVDINAAAVGSVISMTGVLATAAVLSANQTHLAQASPTFVGPGAIGVTTGATSTGAVQWYCRYEPLSPGAYVVAA